MLRISQPVDLIVDPILFGFSTTLHDWPATLQALKKLNATAILLGHGKLESDWSYVDRQIALFDSTWQQVKRAVDGGADLEATHKQVDGDALWKAFGAPSSESRDDVNYDYLDPAIDAAFKVLRPAPTT